MFCGRAGPTISSLCTREDVLDLMTTMVTDTTLATTAGAKDVTVFVVDDAFHTKMVFLCFNRAIDYLCNPLDKEAKQVIVVLTVLYEVRAASKVLEAVVCKPKNEERSLDEVVMIEMQDLDDNDKEALGIDNTSMFSLI
ncbi:hypothetical protein CLAVI_000993 [Candidatus Clavichlamydia salmonicola]|uniref:hypothetical protein n=1 Tax=Candidatus Clavichlamydia salmonicola TaxID=469812 RepID=UPI001890C7E3|nr:hypothetical protein [Candidatus Clavichlamydia salmonicola]MBF5051350.1 hypothetical protein [Candidatus Clavichlamydia salmonicola]